MNGTAFLGMTWGPSEQLKRPCYWQYPKPQGPEKNCVTAALTSWRFSRPYIKAANTEHPLAAGRAGGHQRGCSGWKSWFHTRPNSWRHWSLLRILLWRLFTFQEKNPKTTKIFWEGSLTKLHLLEGKDLFQATSAGSQCTHRLTAGEVENRGRKNNF